MNHFRRTLVVVACIALLIVSWLVAVTMQSDEERQAELFEQAQILLEDGIYILAYPLLEEAAAFDTPKTFEIEEVLKVVYLELINQSGFLRKYTDLLQRQMSRVDAPAEVFLEAAEFNIYSRRLTDALAILIDGYERTGDERLKTLYEQERYAFRTNRTQFEYIMTGFNSTFQVMNDGLWGLAGLSGSVIVPLRHDKISTFSAGRAIVMSGDEIFAVDRNGNRILKLHEDATDIGNFANDRLTLLIDGRWYRANSEFQVGAASFEMIGMHSGGIAAAKEGGRWGAIDLSAEWVIAPEHDEIIMDELGRAHGQGAVFVRNGNTVTLIVNGEQIAGTFEDARPFGNENYAAVKNNGEWGFINTLGEVVINYQFDDALSFSQHLAAVRVGDYWGYVSIYGEIAIEPQFITAKSFNSGRAPVLTDGGWQIIALVEFTDSGGGGGLF